MRRDSSSFLRFVTANRLSWLTRRIGGCPYFARWPFVAHQQPLAKRPGRTVAGRLGEVATGRLPALQFAKPEFGCLTGSEKVIRPVWVVKRLLHSLTRSSRRAAQLLGAAVLFGTSWPTNSVCVSVPAESTATPIICNGLFFVSVRP